MSSNLSLTCIRPNLKLDLFVIAMKALFFFLSALFLVLLSDSVSVVSYFDNLPAELDVHTVHTVPLFHLFCFLSIAN